VTTLDQFVRMARSTSAAPLLVPVWEDFLLDSDTPVSAFARLRTSGSPFAFLLESAPAGGETWSRYTYLGVEPRTAWRLRDDTVEDWTPDEGWHGARRVQRPLDDLRSIITAAQPVEVPELGAFWSGAVGYFGYDLVRHIEHLPDPPERTMDVPDAIMVMTRTLVVMDNLKGTARVVTAAHVPAGATDEDLAELHGAAQEENASVIERLRRAPGPYPLLLDNSAPPATGTGRYEQQKFLADVERIREYIFAGDCFQALLSRRIEVAHDFATSDLYRALRTINPSPYMFHLVLEGVELVGSSPELLVRVADGRVVVRPIAGTRPRGSTPEADDALAKELLADEKERAEHVMLVDLGRNDVGRVARYGSVTVTEFMKIERYSHVLHIVSQVEGALRDGISALDVVAATFPAGTMTGAPKVRAMEIIDELEPERRGPYAGAVGYISAGDLRMDMAITIRTCVVAGGVAAVQAGAGIVADSVAEREWEETENKARAMLTAIGRVRRAIVPQSPVN
jgi:anthranilate synthase component I